LAGGAEGLDFEAAGAFGEAADFRPLRLARSMQEATSSIVVESTMWMASRKR
jgi:hypothetical protein